MGLLCRAPAHHTVFSTRAKNLFPRDKPILILGHSKQLSDNSITWWRCTTVQPEPGRTRNLEGRAHIDGNVIVLLHVMLMMDFLSKPLYSAMKELSMDKPARHRTHTMFTDE